MPPLLAPTTPFAALCRADGRVALRRDGPLRGSCVVYWMARAQRAFGNPAFDFAATLANELGLPLAVHFGPTPRRPRANLRAYAFLFAGVPDVARDVAARGAAFVFRPYPEHSILRFVEEVGAAALVGDEDPLREPASLRDAVAERIRIPFATVDADVLVPSRLFPKAEWAARTLRPKYRRELGAWLTPPATTKVRTPWARPPRGADPAVAAVPSAWRIDRGVRPVPVPAGPRAGRAVLDAFVARGLKGYAEKRNLPELAATSGLSPYVHFGHVGPQEIAWAAHTADAPEADREAFLEEFLVRRELAINFVLRQPLYDALAGCPAWALRTLDEHRADPRPHLYDEAAFALGRTHDPLWNAAQLEMVRTGRMHGYMRMYWAKKILEWSRTPEEAFDRAVRLNDAFELDGRDANGYCGVAWAIGGLHDRPWGPPRPIFGTVRYMSGASTGRKFDSRAYQARIAALPDP